MSGPTRSRACAALAAACLVPGLAAGPLDPVLRRRVAVEDRPLLFEAALPDGMPVAPGLRVGDSRLRYRFRWTLLDPEGERLGHRESEGGRPGDAWESVAIVEPYQASFTGRLTAELEVDYLTDGQVRARGRSRFPVLRIQDVTPPFRTSLGDEEDYPGFAATSLTVPDGGVATTNDRLLAADGEEFRRSPFRAILDDGETLEGASGPREGRGMLSFRWENLFDNLNPPFTGPSHRSLRRFGVYVRPQWDLLGSHPLVGDPGAPHLAATRVVLQEEGAPLTLHLVDLTDTLPEPSPRPGPIAGGQVRIPLPYDRVGDLEVGFYAEDLAWPAPNHGRAGVFRFRVEDDIAPVPLFSMRKVREREETWISVDGVNRRWTSAPSAFGLPERFGGPPMDAVAALAILARTPYTFQVMAFDNTRLDRVGLEVEVRGPRGAVGFGIRTEEGGVRRTLWEVPTDGFDPSLVRTGPGAAPQLYFGVPGEYEVELRARDVHGNRRSLVLPFDVGDREFDRFRVAEEAVRRREP